MSSRIRLAPRMEFLCCKSQKKIKTIPQKMTLVVKSTVVASELKRGCGSFMKTDCQGAETPIFDESFRALQGLLFSLSRQILLIETAPVSELL